MVTITRRPLLPRLLPFALLALLAICVTCGDPTLIFEPGPQVLIVGQKASVVVTEGGDGSTLEANTLSLKDADGSTFTTGANGVVAQKKGDGNEVEFTVPPAIAPGDALLEIKTSKGPAFSGKIKISRLMAVRDLAGKVWLLSLRGKDTAGKMAAAQYAEIQSGQTGVGHGLLAVGYKGRLMASVAVTPAQLHLAWLGSPPKISPAKLFTSETIRALAVSPTGVTLVGSNTGTHVVDPPTNIASQLTVSTILQTKDTLALAVDRVGKGAAALGADSTGALYLSLIVLTGGAPAILGSPIALTGWSSSGATFKPVLAMSPDGKSVLVLDGAGQAGLLREGSSTLTPVTLPTTESGAVAAASNADGTVFYVANQTSANLSVIKVSSNGTPTVGTPVDLSTAIAADAGMIIDLSVSANDEVALLLQHDLLLYDPTGGTTAALAFDYLFKDKTSGEIGGSLAIQP